MKKDTYPKEKYPPWVLCERKKLKEATHKICAVVDCFENPEIDFDAMKPTLKKELLKSAEILMNIYDPN